jgi:uncharacterized membrane protein YgaE (UPF0421/DUF939 family)
VLRVRARQGWVRVRASAGPLALVSLAAGIAWAIARYGLGHPYPFFAPVCTWVALGFSPDRQPRRVTELAIGVALGVALGDVLVHLIGTGWWQITVVLAIAALVARFVDRGALLTMQAGVQAIVIVGLPAVGATGGPLGRWTDALVGGLVALAAAVLTPGDPRRRLRAQAREALSELSAMLRVLARGMRAADAGDVEHALVRGRASQPALDEWRESARSALDVVRVSPAWRRHRDEIAGMQDTAVLVDRAMRNARVLARRALPSLDHGLGDIAAAVEDLVVAVDDLAEAVGSGREPVRVRDALAAIAGRLDPFVLAAGNWHAQSLVLLLRSLVVDVLQAAGEDAAAARELLPEI